MDFQEELREQATRERFLNQAETIEDWGARLERIFTRHVGDGNGRCMWCDQTWPCADRKDAEWTP